MTQTLLGARKVVQLRLQRLLSPQIPPTLVHLFLSSPPPRIPPSPSQHPQMFLPLLWKLNEVVLDFSPIPLTKIPLPLPRNQSQFLHSPLFQSITPPKRLACLG